MTLIQFATYYLYFGAVVAVVFLAFGIGRMDENAQGAWIFRPLLIPGVLLIWPIVIWRCLVLWRGEVKLDRHRMPRRAQEWVALALVVAVVLILMVSLSVRQNPDTLAQPILLEAAE